jgi:type VI secretion system protein ImpC
VAGPDPEQERLVAAIDAQISDLARSILHDPAFERVESLWRSVYALVNAVSDGEGVSVHITAFAQGALAEDQRSAGDELQAAEVFRRIVADNDRVGAEPWAMVVADYYFGHAGVELDTLARLGAISREAGAILLAGAAPDLVGAVDRHALGDAFIWRGADDPAFEDWQALRAADAADAIGLVLPRVLLRHPYSPQSDPIESFDFSEQLASPESRYYLWGNGAFVCARLLVQSFLMHEGWRFNPDGHLEVDDLPMWTFETPAGRALQPVAEVAMSERTAREIDTRGVMALCSIQQRNACRLLRFASVSLHDRSLQGPWTRV